MEKKQRFKRDTNPRLIRFPMVLGAILLIFCSFSMLAAENYYPPRISHIEGGISYESSGDVDWTTATVNLPIFRGDRLFAKPDSRGEVEFGYNSFLRLDENTDVVFSQLSEKIASLNLVLGSIIVRTGKSFHMDVQTRVGVVQLRNKGLYRIDTDESGLTRILVRKGRAEVVDGQEKLKIKEGQMSTVGGDPSLHQAAFNNYDDDFDMWSSRRDALYASSNSVEYVGNYYPGVYTLDNYGYWRTYSGLGRVWVPRVGVGWAPYRSGRWLNFSVGWTWLSYEPWGWMPYHYGYWHYYEPYGHWCWSPGFYGGYTSFGAWSPHCVNFYYGSGYVGWSPRIWGHGSRPGTVVNNNTVVINNNTTIVNNTRGMTVVKANDFSRARVDTAMVSNVSSSVRSGFKAGLPENIVRGTRTAAAAGTSRAGTSGKASAGAMTRDNPAQSRTTEYRDSRGSTGSVSGKTGSIGSARTVTTRDRTMEASRTSGKVTSGNTSGLSSGKVRSIPSVNRGSSSGTVTPSRTVTPRTGTSTTSGQKTTRQKTTTSPKRPSGDSAGYSSRLSSSNVEAIPSSGNSYGRSTSGYSASSGSLSGSRATTSSSARIKSLTGSDVRPSVTTDTRSSRTAQKTYTDRSSSPGFWGRLFGGSSSSSRSSGSSGSYSSSRSRTSGSSSSRSYGSSSRSSSSSRSVSRPSRSYSSSSSSSRPSSRPSSSRPKRP